MAVYSGPNSVEDGLVMLVDSSNKKSFSPNVFPRGTDIYGWYVDTKGNNTAYNCNLTRDTISSPVGNTPLKMSITANDPHLSSYNSSPWNLANAASGESWTISVYVKASQSTTGELVVFGAGSNSQYLEVPNTTVNITTSWTRVSYTATFSNASTVFLQMRLDGTQSGGTGIDIWWDGLQIERGSTVTEFTKEYTLDSSLNERMLDLSGNGHNIALGTAVRYVNSYGGVLNFPDDLDGYGQNTSLNLTNSNYTVMSFVRKNVNGDNGRTINSYSNNWLLGHHDTTYGDYYAEGWVNNISSPTADTTWRMFTGTGNISADSYSLYINADHEVTNSGGSAGPNGWNLNGRPNQVSDCQIANLICYNRVLTAAEVQQNFNALRGRFGI